MSRAVVLGFNRDLCTGCLQCMMACAFKHFGEINLSLSLRRIVVIDGEIYFSYCLHCDHPMCEASCPTKAIRKDEETQWVLISQAECVGCRSCTLACPWSSPIFDERRGVAWKCDMCDGEPECVRVCPTGATYLISREEAVEEYRKVLAEVR